MFVHRVMWANIGAKIVRYNIEMTERDLYKDFKPPYAENAAYELKMTKTGRLLFTAVKEHQRRALLQSQKVLLVRIPDAVGGIGMQLPFDFMSLHEASAYVVVCFYAPRKPKILYYIRIGVFLEAESITKRKSLTESEAKRMATFIAMVDGSPVDK